jgi:WD40 repeat protein
VQSLVFGPDGDRLFTAGIDGTVRVWDVSSGQQLVTIQQHEGQASSVDVSVDGLHMVSADEDDQAFRMYSCEVCGSLEEVLRLAHSRASVD